MFLSGGRVEGSGDTWKAVVVNSRDLLGRGDDFGVDETFLPVQAYPDIAGGQDFGAREGRSSNKGVHGRGKKGRRLHDG